MLLTARLEKLCSFLPARSDSAQKVLACGLIELYLFGYRVSVLK